MARPKVELDSKIFENLCQIQCTKDEICSVFECDEKTLTRWCKDEYGLGFSDVYKKKSKVGKISLRRLQWKSAQSGNVSMLIWLGKQYLGQTDKQELSGDSNQPLIVRFKNSNDK